MNQQLQEFARTTLKQGLSKLGAEQHRIFKLMYAFRDHENQRFWRKAVSPDMTMTIDEVVDNLPEDKLDWAMTQVKTTLDKMGIA